MVNNQRKEIAKTIGNDDFAEQIYIIYHSGISKFTDNTLSTLAENIAKNNYRVTLYHVEKNLKIDFKEAKAIGFASPIYAGSIRQRLANFIQQIELSGIECFVVLTGADKGGRERDNGGYFTGSILLINFCDYHADRNWFNSNYYYRKRERSITSNNRKR
ncbi:unnamed protein product [marine sediment metagenome]|uniref:Flavodoxin domain-containing protein n=1 Tax=marine sediment metagenome TaxID=412755 RepID=X1C4R3_9ZZZZ